MGRSTDRAKERKYYLRLARTLYPEACRANYEEQTGDLIITFYEGSGPLGMSHLRVCRRRVDAARKVLEKTLIAENKAKKPAKPSKKSGLVKRSKRKPKKEKE